jgi:hypothetical protein
MAAMSTVQSSSYADITVRGHPGSTGSCSVCQMVADAFLAENVFPPLGLSVGTWEGFLERKQCVCCQPIVSCLEKYKPYHTKFEPSCSLKLTSMGDCFWISSVRHLEPSKHIILANFIERTLSSTFIPRGYLGKMIIRTSNSYRNILLGRNILVMFVLTLHRLILPDFVCGQSTVTGTIKEPAMIYRNGKSSLLPLL